MRLKRLSCDSIEKYLTSSAPPRVLAFDLPPGLKSQRINQLSSHPRVSRSDFGRCEKEDKERKKIQLVSISAFCDFCALFDGNEGKELRESEHQEKIVFSFRESVRTFLSRFPDSRDERALCAPLKATPDSKPRPFPATLAPEPPLLPSCPVLSLSAFLF